MLPHLDAAYNLARWIMRNDAEADDAVQEACLRALRFVDGLRGADGRVWLLKIVRNTCYSRLGRSQHRELETEFDEALHAVAPEASNPEVLLQQRIDGAALNRALVELPMEFREAIVMRELEGLSYKAIADVTGVPLGTVMSRLARARKRLQIALCRGPANEVVK